MAVKLPFSLLQQVEFLFRATFAREQSEDRLLIYADEEGNLLPVHPEMTRRAGSVQGDVQLTIEHEGRLWDLAFDLHSHHVMGIFWSTTDNANERIRGVIFGVFSWKHEEPKWLFRRFNGQGFEDLLLGEVITGG